MLWHTLHIFFTLLRQVPRMAGRELDLHQLYRNVSALGGCLRVTAEKKWRVRRPGRRGARRRRLPAARPPPCLPA